jgi:hypothetical protein
MFRKMEDDFKHVNVNLNESLAAKSLSKNDKSSGKHLLENKKWKLIEHYKNENINFDI